MYNKEERICANTRFKLHFLWATNKSLGTECEILHSAISCT